MYSTNRNSLSPAINLEYRRIAARQTPHPCLPELRRALLDEWCNIPQDQIDNLIACLGVEDFGKRNMPGKRARRHFSQLSELERGPMIGMKTAGWSTRRVAGQADRSVSVVRNCWEQWTRDGTHEWKTGSGVTRKTTRRNDRMIVRQALVDPTVTPSRIRADVGVAIVPQTISRHLAEVNIKSK
ncbi:uncharacterized protein TNCV_609731 [Trichonephila clavipes]|nr:uncharacterized protein TNCV_609731 [Trichonephila clavipes]